MRERSIFVNKSRGTATIHSFDCRELAKHGGRPKNPARFFYIRGLENRDAARRVAETHVTTPDRVRWCSKCGA